MDNFASSGSMSHRYGTSSCPEGRRKKNFSMMLRLTATTMADGSMQVLSIVTVAVAFVAMAGSIFGMNLYFNVAETPPVSFLASVLSCLLPNKLEICSHAKTHTSRHVAAGCFVISWSQSC